jgi:hypothetical protein
MKAILTRSAYKPDYPIEANRRRLELLRRVTVPSVRAQKAQGWEWIVMMRADDPLRDSRMRAFADAGIPVRFYTSASWPDAVGPVTDPMLLTMRLDDDDAIAKGMLADLDAASAKSTGLLAHVFPHGIRYHHGQITHTRHRRNQFVALQAPGSAPRLVYEVAHGEVPTMAGNLIYHVRPKPAWMWVRHDDARTGQRHAKQHIGRAVREAFEIDWAYLGGVT